MKKRLPLIITCIALAAAIITCGIIFNPFKSDAGKHIEMGQRYLDELQWESALAEFELALEIEPRSVEARLGAAEAYIGLGRYADAVQVLADGYILVGDERLKAALSDERLAEALAEYLAAIDDGQLAGLLSGESVTTGTSAEGSGNETNAVSTEPTVTATRTYPDNEVIVWQDEAFEAMIRQYLGKPEGDIVYADVKNIVNLEIVADRIIGYDEDIFISEYSLMDEIDYTLSDGTEIAVRGSIESLDDLRYFTSLESLTICAELISDLSPLAQLESLRELTINHCQVSDISPLSGLDELVRLALVANDISELSPLSGYAKLERLYVDLNDIADLSPLSGMTALTQLGIDSNPVSDLSPLSGLELKELSAMSCRISDISALTGMISLEQLYLSDNSISDISPLSNLTALEFLDILDTNVSDISPLANLTALEILNISDTNVSDISPLANLTALEYLDVSVTNVTDISPLANLTNLKELYLYNTPVTDLSPLDGIEGLEILY
ncbi:MAG: leucine-rich repeat domain-containing protein [Candidatus Flemingiibacterium sp.]